MTPSLEFVQAAGEPLRRARAQLEDAIAGLPTHEAFLQLRVDFEEVLREDHDVDVSGRALLFGPLESLPDTESRLQQLIHMASSYIVARELGLVRPTTLDTEL